MKQLVLLFLFFSTCTFAQNKDVFGIDTIPTEGLLLDKGWKWQAGDNPEWAKPAFDDSNWEGLDPSLVIPELQTKSLHQHPPRLWLRLKFNNIQKKDRLMISVKQSGATEIYINNHRIHSFGIIDTLHDEIKSYDPNGDYIIIPLDTAENLLAIKYYFEPGIRYKSVFDTRYPLFNARAFPDNSELESNKNKSTFVWEGLNIGVPLILFVVHFIMFLFYRPLRANLWYSLWALLGAISFGFLLGVKTEHHLALKNEYALYATILIGLGNLSLVYSLFLLLRHKNKRMLIPFYCITFLSILSFLAEFDLSFFIDFSLGILLQVSVLYLAYSAYKQGNIGGKYVVYSMGLYIIVWILFVFSFDIFNIGWISDVLFHVAMFCLPITVSILLGIDTRNIHNNLMQVTLEKQQLLQSQNQVLEKEVTERTLDLQYKNRELEIESSLEKVRSRSLAMHNSSEIQDVAYILYGELKKLKFQFGACSVYLIDADDNIESWVAGFEAGEYPQRLFVPKFDHPLYHDQIKAFHDGKKFETLYLTPDIKQRYDDQMFYHTDYKNLKPELIQLMRSMPSVVFSMAYNKYGALHWGPTALSEDEAGILQRFSAVFEQSYTRYLDIKKAEEQTREAKIEAALERVRNRSMVMLKSEEIMDVAVTVYDELQKLDFKFGAATIIIIDKETGFMQHWLAGFFQRDHVKSYAVDNIDHPLHAAQLKAWRNEEKFISIQLSGTALKEYALETINDTGYKNLPDEEKEMLLANEQAVFNLAFMKHGALMWAPSSLSDEQAIILQRFAQVFEQTFTRFLDLQKAEAQAREAQIEVAVERVRAQSMAMHHTSDLTNVNAELLTQLNKLNIAGLTGVTFYLVDEKEVVKVWDLSSPGNMGDPNSYSFKYDSKEFPILGEFVGIWKAAKQDYFILDFPKEKLEKAVVELRQIQPEVAEQFRNAIDSGALQHQWNPVGRLSNGILSIDLMQAPSEDIKTIVIKMAGAFNMAYQRFLDLQKAEAQAREAKIEASLERIRGRAMAMHNSTELKEVARELRTQLGLLGAEALETCAINLYGESDESIHALAATRLPNSRGEITESDFLFPKRGIAIIEEVLAAYSTGVEECVILNDGAKSAEWMNVLAKALPDVFEIVAESTGFNKNAEIRVWWTCAFFENGSLIMITMSPPDEASRSLLKRFALVFGLAYRRFADLKKAEAQAREAQIEVALERVRSRTMAMHKSDELHKVVATIYDQLQYLGFTYGALGIVIMDKISGDMNWWMAGFGKEHYPENYHIPYFDHPFYLAQLNAWKDEKKFVALEVSGEEKKAYDNIIFSKTDFVRIPFEAQKVMMGFEKIIFSNANMKHGALSWGTNSINDDQAQVLQRLAIVFEQTYTRFLDLQKAEALAEQAKLDLIHIQTEKKRAEDALSDLHITQNQLIQKEKLASLGELTAGIAHEIQNPLNFVNNFSEINSELIGELVYEVDKGNTSEVKLIAADIKENSEKINHHGKRAESIVKGMLEHSRKSTGVKEPTHINKLCEEFVRLSYQGLRAKDKSFYCDYKLDLDPNLPIANAVSQDIGRVILNIVNNAFQSVQEQQLKLVDFKSMVTVTTNRINDTSVVSQHLTTGAPTHAGLWAIISISDNGPGIPDHIKDKIFQPFFTTKPAGQGTGLGLSLAYDIVKAHGGELKVVTRPGAGSEFIIQLPIV